jgi:hypothetical protein
LIELGSGRANVAGEYVADSRLSPIRHVTKQARSQLPDPRYRNRLRKITA